MKKNLMVIILGMGIGGNLIDPAGAAESTCSCEFAYEMCLESYGIPIEQCRSEYQRCATRDSPACDD